MIEKPKRPKKVPNQDNKQPQTIQELIRRYDLDNTKIYDFLDELVDFLKITQEEFAKEEKLLATINGTDETVSKDFTLDLSKYRQFALRLYLEWEGVRYYFASEIYDVSLIKTNSMFQIRNKKWNDSTTVELATFVLIESNAYRLTLKIPEGNGSTYFAVYGIK